MATYQDLLHPQVLTVVVKQVVASADAILPFMGFQPGGSNEKYYGHGREGVFHVYDDSRKPAKGRAPGTAAGRSSKQPMKAVPFVYPRMHDSKNLLAEFFHNIGLISDPAVRDVAGRDMIARQTATQMQEAANWLIAMTVGMMKDSLYIHEDGDDWYVNYTSSGSLVQRDTRVPAGNKTQGNMTNRAGTSVFNASVIDSSWDNSSSEITLQFARINQARAAQGVGPVKHVHCNSIVWQNLIKNDDIAALAGAVNPPFTRYERNIGERPDGSPLHEYTGTINSLPGVTFHISDDGVELYDAPTDTHVFTKHWPDTMALMMGEPIGTQKYTMYQGSEPIAEYDGGPKTVRVGLSSWSKAVSDPTGDEIYILNNCLPVAHDPFDLLPLTVIF